EMLRQCDTAMIHSLSSLYHITTASLLPNSLAVSNLYRNTSMWLPSIAPPVSSALPRSTVPSEYMIIIVEPYGMIVGSTAIVPGLGVVPVAVVFGVASACIPLLFSYGEYAVTRNFPTLNSLPYSASGCCATALKLSNLSFSASTCLLSVSTSFIIVSG